VGVEKFVVESAAGHDDLAKAGQGVGQKN
jgi:hypothetical protein